MVGRIKYPQAQVDLRGDDVRVPPLVAEAKTPVEAERSATFRDDAGERLFFSRGRDGRGRFVWDSINSRKIAEHGLDEQDVEGVFDEGPVVFQHPDHAERWLALGFVPEPDDRSVLVSFELDEKTEWARVVTAFEPTNEKWWKIYAKAKGIKA